MADDKSTANVTQPPNDEGLRCPTCEYNLTGLTENVCPECGEAFDREQLLAAWGGQPAPIPIWGERETIGGFNAFMLTLFQIWFRPIRYAKHFPLIPHRRDPIIFSRWCLRVSLLVAAGPLVAGSIGHPDVLIRLAVLTLWMVIGIALCEWQIAATLFASLRRDTHDDNAHLNALCLVRMTRGFLLLSAIWMSTGGVGMLVLDEPLIPDPLGIQLYYALLVYWWICMAAIAAAYRRNVWNFFLALVMLPIVFGVSFGLTGIFIEATLGNLFTISRY